MNNLEAMIYDYLIDVYEHDSTKWLTQYEIAQKLFNYYGYRAFFHDTKLRNRITKAIQNINDDETAEYIVLSGTKGVKIANATEYNKYLSLRMKSVVRSINRLKKCYKKANRNGQFKFELTESGVEFIETKTFGE